LRVKIQCIRISKKSGFKLEINHESFFEYEGF